MALFEGLNDALAHYVAAETDLRQVDCWDPAYRPWLTASEDTHAEVIRTLAALLDAEAYHPDDALRLEKADATRAFLSAETCSEFHAGSVQVQHCLRLCALSQFGFGSRIPGLIRQVERHLHALIMLDLKDWDEEFESAGANWFVT